MTPKKIMDQIYNLVHRQEKPNFVPTLNDFIREEIIRIRTKAANRWRKKLEWLANHRQYKDAEFLYNEGPKRFLADEDQHVFLTGILRLRKTLRSLTRNLDSKNSSLAQADQESQLSKFLTAFLYPVNESRNEETEESQIAK